MIREKGHFIKSITFLGVRLLQHLQFLRGESNIPPALRAGALNTAAEQQDC